MSNQPTKSQSSDTEPTESAGVWIVYVFNNDWVAQSLHAEEIDALRAVERRGYGKVLFVPFGTDVDDVIVRSR